MTSPEPYTTGTAKRPKPTLRYVPSTNGCFWPTPARCDRQRAAGCGRPAASILGLSPIVSAARGAIRPIADHRCGALNQRISVMPGLRRAYEAITLRRV